MHKNKIHFSRTEYRNEYLSSDHWSNIRSKVLKRDLTCRVCEKQKAQDAHHLTYENLYFENIETDLIGVCRQCHNRIHRHEELSEIKSLSHLKWLFFRSYKKYKITNRIYDSIMREEQKKSKIAGIFKMRISEFNKLKNLEVDYFTMQKVFKVLNSTQKLPAKKTVSTIGSAKNNPYKEEKRKQKNAINEISGLYKKTISQEKNIKTKALLVHQRLSELINRNKNDQQKLMYYKVFISNATKDDKTDPLIKQTLTLIYANNQFLKKVIM